MAGSVVLHGVEQSPFVGLSPCPKRELWVLAALENHTLLVLGCSETERPNHHSLKSLGLKESL